MVEYPPISQGRYICYIDMTNVQSPSFRCQSVDKVLIYGGITVIVLYLLLNK